MIIDRLRTAVTAILLVVASAVEAQWTGFDPDTPPEPGQRGVVVLTSRPEGAATLIGGGSYTPGTTARISSSRTSAVWKFEGWLNESGDTISRSTSISLPVTTGVTRLAACYKEDTDTFHVALSANPAEAIYNMYGGGTYDNTERPYIHLSKRTGFRFQNWTRNGEVVSEQQSFYYDRRDGENDVTLVANFIFDPTTPAEPDTARLRHTVYIQCDPDVGGTVNYPDGTTMLEGDEITLTARPNKDFVFMGWLRDGVEVSSEKSYTLRMGRTDTYMTARFMYSPDTPEEPLMPVQHTYAVYAGTVTVNPGLSVYLPISLENTGDIDKLEFTLRMPRMFTVDTSKTQTTARTQGFGTTTACRVAGDSTEVDVRITGDKPFAYNNGAVVNLYLTAADTTLVGIYGINFVSATGYDGTNIRHSSTHGGIIIVERALPTDMLGDVNGDGRINIQDVAMLTGYIHGRRYDSFIKKNADINGDGRINIADVALLVELVIIYNM